MKYNYKVSVLEMLEVHELPNAWESEDFLNLLNQLEFEDADQIPPEELKDMTSMALSDLDPDDAALEIINVRIGENLNKGQKMNLIEELKEDRLWEEYSDLKLHKEIFNITSMLHWAFPKKYAEPDIVKISLSIKAENTNSEANLRNPSPSFLSRLLNNGMDEHNIIYRLFDDKLEGNSFPEAEHIIWLIETEPYQTEEQTLEINIYTAWHWVDELRGVDNYNSSAYSDGQL